MKVTIVIYHVHIQLREPSPSWQQQLDRALRIAAPLLVSLAVAMLSLIS